MVITPPFKTQRPKEAPFQKGSRIFNMAMSYYNNSLDHLADGCCIASCCPVVLSSHCPLTAPPFHRLITQANCCIASLCAAVLSSRRATLSSSHRPLTSHCTAFLSLIAQAGCCLASRHAAVCHPFVVSLRRLAVAFVLSSSSHCTILSLSCAGWLLCCLLLRRPHVLSSHCPLVLLLCIG